MKVVRQCPTCLLTETKRALYVVLRALEEKAANKVDCRRPGGRVAEGIGDCGSLEASAEPTPVECGLGVARPVCEPTGRATSVVPRYIG
jgi:hypothetical protein